MIVTSRQAIAAEIKRPLGGFHFAAASLSFRYNPNRGLQDGVSDALKAHFAQCGIVIVWLFHPYQPVLCNLFDRFDDLMIRVCASLRVCEVTTVFCVGVCKVVPEEK